MMKTLSTNAYMEHSMCILYTFRTSWVTKLN